VNNINENNNHKIDVFEYEKNIDNITKTLGIINNINLYFTIFTNVNIYHIYKTNIVTRNTENLIGHPNVA
jgi:hypothetical protein